MKFLGMCIDKRVVAGVVAAGLLLWWLRPEAISAALPFLILAICPLSMLMMMKMMGPMNGQQSTQQPAQPQADATPPSGAEAAAPASAMEPAGNPRGADPELTDVERRRN